jgi:hypothetical protein
MRLHRPPPTTIK